MLVHTVLGHSYTFPHHSHSRPLKGSWFGKSSRPGWGTGRYGYKRSCCSHILLLLDMMYWIFLEGQIRGEIESQSESPWSIRFFKFAYSLLLWKGSEGIKCVNGPSLRCLLMLINVIFVGQGSGFDSWVMAFLYRVWIFFPVSVWVFSRYSSFLPQSKNIQSGG